jgi:hypothetical protein
MASITHEQEGVAQVDRTHPVVAKVNRHNNFVNVADALVVMDADAAQFA